MLVTAAAAWTVAAPAHAAVKLNKIGDFNSPVFVAAAPGDTSRLFVVEQGGTVRLIKNGKLQRKSFLTVANVKSGGEQGLLSIAFDASSGGKRRLYVFYTTSSGCNGGNCDLQIDEFTWKSGRDNVRSKTRRAVLTIPHRANANHNGGQLQFGPDGNLWIGTGDGGGAGDLPNNAQNVNSLLGKILRINPRASNGRPYTVPNGNPFVGDAGADEVWAYGLRNPYRFSFDRANGDLWIGDVGQAMREEIDHLPGGSAGGANFGWRVCEGDLQFPTTAPCAVPPAGHVPPVFTYATHQNGTCAVTGGYVSRDRSVSELRGRYLWSDYCTGGLFTLTLQNGQGQPEVLGVSLGPGASSFGQDGLCRLYVSDLDGPVYRIESTNPSGSPGCAGASSRGERREQGRRRSSRKDRTAREDKDTQPVEEDSSAEPIGVRLPPGRARASSE